MPAPIRTRRWRIAGDCRANALRAWPATAGHPAAPVIPDRCRMAPRCPTSLPAPWPSNRADTRHCFAAPPPPGPRVSPPSRRRERAARLRPAHPANHVDNVLRRARCPRRRILTLERNEAAVDDHDAAARQPPRREPEISGTLNVGPQRGARRIDQCLLSADELGRKGHAAEFVLVLRQMLPIATRRQRTRRRVETLGQLRDQILFPDLAVELPDAEPDQDGEAGHGKDRRLDHAGAALFTQWIHTSLRCSRRPSAAL